MFNTPRSLLAALRAVTNEIADAQAIPESLQDEELALYQRDLFEALGELSERYAEHAAADAALPPLEELLAGYKSHPWPNRRQFS